MRKLFLIFLLTSVATLHAQRHPARVLGGPWELFFGSTATTTVTIMASAQGPIWNDNCDLTTNYSGGEITVSANAGPFDNGWGFDFVSSPSGGEGESCGER